MREYHGDISDGLIPSGEGGNPTGNDNWTGSPKPRDLIQKIIGGNQVLPVF